MYSNKELKTGCFNEKFPKIFIKTIVLKCFWIGAPKTQTKPFSRAPLDATGWVKKRSQINA